MQHAHAVQVLRRFGLKDKVDLAFGERYKVGSNLKWSPTDTQHRRLGHPQGVRARMRAEMLRALTPHTSRDTSIKFVSVNKAEKLRLGKIQTERGRKRHAMETEFHRQLAIERGWRERLRSAEQHMPAELLEPQFEKQRQRAEAQRQEPTAEELRQRTREFHKLKNRRLPPKLFPHMKRR